MDLDYGRGAWFGAASRFSEAVAHSSNFPLAYVYAVFLAVSGHLIGRRTHIRYATPLYANQYVTLVGASGIAHKSTAMNLGIESISDFWMTPPLHNVSTRQGLLLAMRESDGQAFLALDELASLLTRKRQDFAADLLISLTELYSCPRSAGTYTRKDPIIVENCYLTVMAGSTVEWIQTSITAQDLMAGFGNRMTWVLGSPRPEASWPKKPYWDDFKWETLSNVPGECRLSDQADDLWHDYYIRFQGRQRRANNFTRTMAERIPEKVLKCALVQCAWAQTDIIDDEILAHAIDWGHYLYRCVLELMPRLEDSEHQVLGAIERGCNTRPKLYRELSTVLGGERIRRALTNLMWLSLVEEHDGDLTLRQKRGKLDDTGGASDNTGPSSPIK